MHPGADPAGIRTASGATVMITRQKGLLARNPRAVVDVAEFARERERLRRELLKRILDRETRRQALRGVRS
jgi:hypothetical protein